MQQGNQALCGYAMNRNCSLLTPICAFFIKRQTVGATLESLFPAPMKRNFELGSRLDKF